MRLTVLDRMGNGQGRVPTEYAQLCAESPADSLLLARLVALLRANAGVSLTTVVEAAERLSLPTSRAG